MKIIFSQIFEKVMLRLENDLPSYFIYHNAVHTKYVVDKSTDIARKENVSGHELLLLNVVALYHDIGLIIQRENHERLGCSIVADDMKVKGFSEPDIELVCGMIMATKVPQQPKTKLEKILADADLEYLGTNNFDSFSQKLFEELQYFNPTFSPKQWYEVQIEFISNHSYHTDYCRKYKEPKKLKNLEKVRKMATLIS